MTVSADDLLQDIPCGFGPDEELGIRIVMGDVTINAWMSSGTLVNTPRRSRWVVMSRKNRSTILSQDAEVGMALLALPDDLTIQYVECSE